MDPLVVILQESPESGMAPEDQKKANVTTVLNDSEEKEMIYRPGNQNSPYIYIYDVQASKPDFTRTDKIAPLDTMELGIQSAFGKESNKSILSKNREHASIGNILQCPKDWLPDRKLNENKSVIFRLVG